MLYHGIRMTADRYHVKVTAPNDSAIDIKGRTIVGMGEGAVLFSGQTDGGMQMGPGPFVIEAVPFSPPPTPPIRRDKVGRNEMCPCGSGLKYKKCCLDK
jgi:SEC-C motif